MTKWFCAYLWRVKVLVSKHDRLDFVTFRKSVPEVQNLPNKQIKLKTVPIYSL